MAPMKRHAEGMDSRLGETVSLFELARRWHMTRKELRHLLGRGRLRFVQIDGSLRVPREAIEGFERSGPKRTDA